MTNVDIQERYDSFQKDAVRAIANDFEKKLNGRYLLVIPTGGGKTITAVKAICQLYADNVLDSSSDKVLWTAHRQELLNQAEEAFIKIIDSTSAPISLDNNIRIEMISVAPKALQDESVKLAVIDEAHHGAASSYQPLFKKSSIGLLGLTATPSRHDGAPLEFDRESFSIGFPDLVKKGIILRPDVRTVEGGQYDFGGFSDDDLEALNNKERNERIVRHLAEKKDEYNKIIIYVGTKAHAKQLYKVLKGTSFADGYDSISYIIGGENSRNQSREDFIEQEKEYKRSILVNVQVLTEGYDDPKVNTVVMATPSKSKLYYMQALGRGIRIDPDDALKQAYVVEVVDELPNIRYRIDNRWLYSDISDALEPSVDDVTYSNKSEFQDEITNIFTKYSVPKEWRVVPDYNEDYRYSMLVFRQYRGPGNYVCFPLVISNENRTRIGNMFNFISERMAHSAKFAEYNNEAIFKMLGVDGVSLISENSTQKIIIDAMRNARAICITDEDQLNEFVRLGHPWLNFVALHFRKKQEDLPGDLLSFIQEMVNREQILEVLKDRDYEKGAILVRLPLPLGFYVGKMLTKSEFDEVNKLVVMLGELKEKKGSEDHRDAVDVVVGEAILPIEIRHSTSLITIVRESLDYYYSL